MSKSTPKSDRFCLQIAGQTPRHLPQLRLLLGGDPAGTAGGPPEVQVRGDPGGLPVRRGWLRVQGPHQEGQGAPAGVSVQERR